MVVEVAFTGQQPSTQSLSATAATSTAPAAAAPAANAPAAKDTNKVYRQVVSPSCPSCFLLICLRFCSWEEIARHNKPNDCWVVVEGVVLDVTSFLPDHPGGKVNPR